MLNGIHFLGYDFQGLILDLYQLNDKIELSSILQKALSKQLGPKFCLPLTIYILIRCLKFIA